MRRREPATRNTVRNAGSVPLDRTARKLSQRIAAAEGNVAIAVEAAREQGRVGGQLEHAVNQWRLEASRAHHEVRTASRLTGRAKRIAYKRLRAQVEAIEDVAARIVESAFTERLTPESHLQEVTDSLDALDSAYQELEGIDPPSRTRRLLARLTRRR